jgi:hypothetical protein
MMRGRTWKASRSSSIAAAYQAGDRQGKDRESQGRGFGDAAHAAAVAGRHLTRALRFPALTAPGGPGGVYVPIVTV